MTGNRGLAIAFGVVKHILSWVGLLVFLGIKYGVYLKVEGAAFVGVFGLGILFAAWMLFRSLKETAETGYALNKKIARAVRALIPLGLVFMMVMALNTNIGGIVDVITFGLAGNIAALPFGILSYRCSQEYIRDTSGNEIVRRLDV
jgi:hypothetical protein